MSDFKANSNFSSAGSSPAGQHSLGAMTPQVPVEKRKFAFTLCVFVYGSTSVLKSVTSIPRKVVQRKRRANLRKPKGVRKKPTKPSPLRVVVLTHFPNS